MSKIYLISTDKIDLKTFSPRLENVLKTGLVPVFQMRLKGYDEKKSIEIARELRKICDDNNCLFLVNDSYKIALEAGAGGVHLGVDDGSIIEARKKTPKNFVIGASCYDSKHLAVEAAEQGADYISFGAFFPTTTKVSRGKPTTEIITWAKEMMNLPVVTIGGINDQNCTQLTKAGADFISVISYIWNHPKGETEALKLLNESLSN